MENEELMELPYGPAFKEKWEAYVNFMKGHNKNTTIKAQNWVLKQYLKNNLNEEEAIANIQSCWNIVIKYLIKQNI